MRIRRFLGLAVVAATATLVGCEDADVFTATLAAPEGITSDATGSATFTLMDDGITVSYTVTVANIESATLSHIHEGAAGQSGSIVVDLFTGQAPFTGSGTLATGTFTAEDVKTGNFETLLEDMRTGGVYVNVHTEANPGGEIRGQINAQ